MLDGIRPSNFDIRCRLECIKGKALLECISEGRLFDGVRRRDGFVGVHLFVGVHRQGTAFCWSVSARDSFVGVRQKDGFDGVHWHGILLECVGEGRLFDGVH